jgi:predicted RNA-binding protein with PIN domain
MNILYVFIGIGMALTLDKGYNLIKAWKKLEQITNKEIK